MKFFVMLIAALLWGIISSFILPYPTSLIIAIIGGFGIGFFWDKIWNAITS